MTKLLDKAIAELHKLPILKQDEVAACVLELVAAADTMSVLKAPVIGRSKDLVRYGSPDADLDNLLTVDDIQSWTWSTIDGR